MKNNKKNIALLAVSLLALVLVVGGAAYAYFQARMDSGSSANINATTATTDSLKFEDGKPLSITADLDNFAEGAGNETDSTMVSAKLIANNTTNSATYYYNVYLDILSNDLKYTTEEKTAELIMQVVDSEDNPITSIPGLNYETIGGISGFDITEEIGLITIASNYEIKAEAATSPAQKTDEWEVTLVLVNLDTDQSENMGKSLSAKVLIQQEEKEGSSKTFADKIISTYGKDDALLLHNSSLANSANDGSYRYSGANPNNYVCFGSTATPCPEDNLYRIIGVFGNQVKLIKNTSIGNYYWSGSTDNTSNVWENSTLNTGTLNGTYLNGLETAWNNKIATIDWKVGGKEMSYITADNTAKKYYDAELGTSSPTYSAKIGLMYVSDYGYAASSDTWANTISRSNNWINSGIFEWTISPSSIGSTFAYWIHRSGGLGNLTMDLDYSGIVAEMSYGVRPTFYLNSYVIMESGKGTSTKPYRLNQEEITFKIGNREYTAEKGMTWQDWVNSDYDKSYLMATKWEINYNSVWANIFSSKVTDPATNSLVSPNEVIKDGYEYTVSTSCFEKDTLIYTTNGYKNIQDIKVGDKVFSYNENTKAIEEDIVTQTFEHVAETIYAVTLEDGTIIKITPNHPVYDKKTQSWKAIAEFKVGDVLTTNTGKEIKITSMELLEEETKVYNIEVSKNHNYFVTDRNILVHNKT